MADDISVRTCPKTNKKSIYLNDLLNQGCEINQNDNTTNKITPSDFAELIKRRINQRNYNADNLTHSECEYEIPNETKLYSQDEVDKIINDYKLHLNQNLEEKLKEITSKIINFKGNINNIVDEDETNTPNKTNQDFYNSGKYRIYSSNWLKKSKFLIQQQKKEKQDSEYNSDSQIPYTQYKIPKLFNNSLNIVYKN
jgi:hypothetical protein